MLKIDVCIIGTGPAGAMAALRLHKSSVPFVAIDKAVFPRDKVCGDALSAKVAAMMKRISPELVMRLEQDFNPLRLSGLKFTFGHGHSFEVPFYDGRETNTVYGYTLRRKNFDMFMASELARVAPQKHITGEAVKSVVDNGNGFVVETEGTSVEAKMIIDSSGSASYFRTDYPKPSFSPNKTAVAVRTYYEGVAGLDGKKNIELLFLKDIVPGYFWIFPLPDGTANVGLGLRKDIITKRKLKLHKLMDELIDTHPALRDRFANAKPLGKVSAHSLPLGKPENAISGRRYLMAGDAAQLVDPLTGEGVGNAVMSGYYAAEQAISCLENDNFEPAFMKAYDKRILGSLGKEMEVSTRLQQMMKYHRIMGWVAKRAGRSKYLPDFLSSLLVDMENIKKLYNPFFLLKLLS